MCKAYDQSAVAAIMNEHARRSARPLVKKNEPGYCICEGDEPGLLSLMQSKWQGYLICIKRTQSEKQGCHIYAKRINQSTAAAITSERARRSATPE